jgi:hypothetical protein
MEAGDLSEWDTTVVDGGDLSAHANAACVGSYGLQAVIDDTTAIYAQEDQLSLTRLRYGFYFQAASLTMSNGDTFTLAGSSGADHKIELAYDGSNYKLRAVTSDDTSTTATDWVTISQATWYWIEADFLISSAPGADDGFVKLWVTANPTSESPDAQQTGVDNDTIDYDNIPFGARSLDAGTSGTLYFDYVVMNDTGTAIGAPSLAGFSGLDVATYIFLAAVAAGTTIPVIMHHRQQQRQS